MNNPYNPCGIDWQRVWIERERVRHNPDDASYWDERAESFSKRSGESNYKELFLEYAQLKEGESVFDMGAGAGALSIPLAKAGHPVVAADFSKNMLHYLKENAKQKHINCSQTSPDHNQTGAICCIQTSWTDDWAAAGINEKSVDVAFASRSISTENLKEALLKLESVARRRVCITLPTGERPRYDEKLWNYLGRELVFGGSHIIAFNMICDMKRMPELRYIINEKYDSYESEEIAKSAIRESLREIKAHEEELLEQFFKEHLTTRITTDGRKVWTRDYSLDASWAFISWNVEN